MFGGIPLQAGGYDQLTSGWIHWCKIWYEDLGNTVIRQIANMPRETYRWEFDMPGLDDTTGRYLLGTGAEYCKASFWMNGCMTRVGKMNDERTNIGGWASTKARTFANDRILKAMPFEWQSVMASVRIPSSAGNNSLGIIYSTDKIYMPAYAEVATVSSEPYTSEAPLGQIRYATNQRTRVKWRGCTIPEDAQYIVYSNDPSAYVPPNPGEDSSISGYTRALRDGDIWGTSTSTYNIYVYVSAETAAKHSMLYGTAKSSATAASNGGYWVPAVYYLTRSPYYWSSGGTSASEYFRDFGRGYSGSNQAANSPESLTYGFSI